MYVPRFILCPYLDTCYLSLDIVVLNVKKRDKVTQEHANANKDELPPTGMGSVGTGAARGKPEA